ncbi:hypothetical protein ACR6C2_27835 [Streptomyces sp. INA 01156]
MLLPGPERTFTENKRPFVDCFKRTLPDLSLPVEKRSYWAALPAAAAGPPSVPSTPTTRWYRAPASST